MGANGRRYALGLAIAAAIAVVAIVSLSPRAAPPVVTSSPSPSPPTAVVPRILFVHAVVLDTVPGGGPIMTSAYDSFEVLAPGGTRQSHAISGLAVGTPAFDGTGRVAFWRRASLTRSPLTLSGAYEVAVWDIRADRERVVLTLTDERSNGELLWTADRKSLVVPTRTAPGAAGAPHNRLILIDADTGSTRVLHASAGDAGIDPLFADSQVVVGVRGSSYVVLDTASGAVRTQTPTRFPCTFLVECAAFGSTADGTVFELLRRFEGEAGPLRIWNVRDAGTDVAKVDERGIYDPLFWPGRTEVVFSASTGLRVVDYVTGQTRRLLSPADVHRVLAVEVGGRFALVQTASGQLLFERIGDELKARPDLQITAGSTLLPLGVLLR